MATIVAPESVNEGDGSFVFSIVYENVSTLSTSYSVFPSASSVAEPGLDYEDLWESGTIGRSQTPPADYVQQFTVHLTNDQILEGPETIVFYVSSSGVTFENGFSFTTFSVTLNDDDAPTIGNDFIYGTWAVDTIDGLAGDDTLFGREGDDTLSGGIGIDALFGEAGDDTLSGGLGADILNGDVGFDTASYAGAASAVGVDLLNSRGSAGEALGDQLSLIERVIGSGFNDVISGDNGANTLEGGNGADYLRGNGGIDRLIGDAGNDRLIGDDGNDVLIGGLGADRLEGGAGFDTADYSAAAGTVIVDLIAGKGTFGEALGDTFTSIEDVVGSSSNDKIIGTAGNNYIVGGAGLDQLIGYLGDDRLLGGDGIDTLRGEAGADRLEGGAGGDWTWYATSNAGVTVNLISNQGFGGHAQGDTFLDIEYAYGSNFNDTLIGNAGNNYLVGASGDDAINGKEGNDRLRGGAGTDTIWGDVGADRFDFYQGDQQDTIADFQNDIDTLYLYNLGFATAAEALATASQSGAHTVFDFGDGDTLVVRNTLKENLIDDLVVVG